MKGRDGFAGRTESGGGKYMDGWMVANYRMDRMDRMYSMPCKRPDRTPHVPRPPTEDSQSCSLAVSHPTQPNPIQLQCVRGARAYSGSGSLEISYIMYRPAIYRGIAYISPRFWLVAWWSGMRHTTVPYHGALPHRVVTAYSTYSGPARGRTRSACSSTHCTVRTSNYRTRCSVSKRNRTIAVGIIVFLGK